MQLDRAKKMNWGSIIIKSYRCQTQISLKVKELSTVPWPPRKIRTRLAFVTVLLIKKSRCLWHVSHSCFQWPVLIDVIVYVTGNSSWKRRSTKRRMTQGGNYWWGRWCQPKPYLPYRCPRGKERSYKRRTIMGLGASDYK